MALADAARNLWSSREERWNNHILHEESGIRDWFSRSKSRMARAVGSRLLDQNGVWRLTDVEAQRRSRASSETYPGRPREPEGCNRVVEGRADARCRQ